MEYLPIGGLQAAIDGALHLAYGSNAPVLAQGRVAALQTLSGTGACRMFAEAVRRYLPGSIAYLPRPTWSNHHNIFRDAGVPVREYAYYDPATRGLDLDGMLHDLARAPEGSVVLLHACAHNPTGVDPSPKDWAQISQLMRARNLFPMFDMAYQGFASGDFDADAAAVRRFVDDGHSLALAQSFAKNLGLYGQRVGVLSVVTGCSDEASALNSQLRAIARPMYSSPPCTAPCCWPPCWGTRGCVPSGRARSRGWQTASATCAACFVGTWRGPARAPLHGGTSPTKLACFATPA